MITLSGQRCAGLGSFFIGTSLQTSMPLFAHDLGAGSAGTAYGVLLFANGAGGVIGGILLEATGTAGICALRDRADPRAVRGAQDG